MDHLTVQPHNKNVAGLVSVIIPTINRASLELAVDSVLKQDYREIEIIIVGDGVMPNLTQLSRESEIPVFTFEAVPTGRPGPLRNIGIKQARGQFLAFLDDDDLWAPDKLSKQILAARHNQTNLVCSNALVGNHQGRPLYYFRSIPKTAYFSSSVVNPVILSSLLIKRNDSEDAFEPTFPESERYRGFEDHIYVLQHLEFNQITFLNDALVKYQNEGIDRLSSQLFHKRNAVIGSTNLCAAKLLIQKPSISRFGLALWHLMIWMVFKLYGLLPTKIMTAFEQWLSRSVVRRRNHG